MADRLPKSLDQLRRCIRKKHYSLRTERAYAYWARWYIRFHGLRHPRAMSERVEVRMTPTQHYAFDRKGGAVWLRSTLDRDIANMP
jgi:hypothetical protein